MKIGGLVRVKPEVNDLWAKANPYIIREISPENIFICATTRPELFPAYQRGGFYQESLESIGVLCWCATCEQPFGDESPHYLCEECRGS